MLDTRRHPTTQQLAAYSLGKLADSELSAVYEHISACNVCRQQVENQPPDSFMGKIRAAKPRTGSMAPTILPSLSHTNLPVRQGAARQEDDVPAELLSSSKYEILGKLGQGGMGAVYKARHNFLGELVAIKVMNAAVVENPEARSRFLREMQATAKLKHPNIVRALDAEQIGDLLVLVVEYVAGRTLDRLVKERGPLPVTFSCQCILQAALGLQHAHEKGMVHRDIKPANLMVTAKEKEVKVLDFGLARGPRAQMDPNNQTQMQTFMGTPEYVAPEQATDARSADIRADIYSLGCTLYCLLAGRPPFQEGTVMGTIVAHVQDVAQPLTAVRTDVPVELAAVAAKMMSKNPADRYQTPDEVAQALKPFMTRRGKSEGLSALAAPLLAAANAGTPLPSPSRIQSLALADETGGPRFCTEAASDSMKSTMRRRRAKGLAKEPGKPSARTVYACVATAGVVMAALFGFLVLTLSTSKGKVVVEIDQADAQVFVDGQKIRIQVAGELQPIEIQVDEGQHQLKVTKDGFQTVTQQFSYSKGAKAFVRVQMQQTKQIAASRPKEPAVRPDVAPKSRSDERGNTNERNEKPSVRSSNVPTKPESVKPNVRVEEEFVSLFNGKDLDGWQKVNSHRTEWAASDGVLIGKRLGPTGPQNVGFLITKRNDFANFHLRLETMLSEGTSSNLAFRLGENLENFTRGLWPKGYLLHLGGTDQARTDNKNRTIGTVWDCTGRTLGEARKIPLEQGRWFGMELIVAGNSFKVIIDGKQVLAGEDPANSFSKGRIALQCRPFTVVKFRRIEVKELPATSSTPKAAPLQKQEEVQANGQTVVLGTWDWKVEGNKLGGAGADVRLERVSAREWNLVPKGNAGLAILKGKAIEQVGLEDLRKATYSTGKLSGTSLTAGTVVALRTREGKFAKFKVVGYRDFHDTSFPEAKYLKPGWIRNARAKPNIKAYHLEVAWTLYR